MEGARSGLAGASALALAEARRRGAGTPKPAPPGTATPFPRAGVPQLVEWQWVTTGGEWRRGPHGERRHPGGNIGGILPPIAAAGCRRACQQDAGVPDSAPLPPAKHVALSCWSDLSDLSDLSDWSDRSPRPRPRSVADARMGTRGSSHAISVGRKGVRDLFCFLFRVVPLFGGGRGDGGSWSSPGAQPS